MNKFKQAITTFENYGYDPAYEADQQAAADRREVSTRRRQLGKRAGALVAAAAIATAAFGGPEKVGGDLSKGDADLERSMQVLPQPVTAAEQATQQPAAETIKSHQQ